MGIFPEVLFHRRRTFGGEVLADQVEDLRVGSPLVAVGPVAAVDQTIGAEDVPDFIQARAVKVQLFGDAAVNPAEHLRHLDVHLGALSQFAQIGLISRAGGGPAWGWITWLSLSHPPSPPPARLINPICANWESAPRCTSRCRKCSAGLTAASPKS